MTVSNLMLAKMLTLVTSKFESVLDKGGHPYALHCIRVMQNLKTSDIELNCIALGHDLLEDCKDITPSILKEMGFTQRVIHGIELLTKSPEYTQEQYEERVLSSLDSLRVKEADLKDNTDITRLKGIREKDFERMKKYHAFWLKIQERKSNFNVIF